jgi:predicted RNase H-like nuclease (RuvC/YqgF family)
VGKVEVEKIKSYLRENLVSHMKQPLIIGFAIVLIIISFIIGKQTTTVAIDNEKVRFDELVNKINSKTDYYESMEKQIREIEDELQTKKDEQITINQEINKNKAAFDEAKAIINNKESNLNEIKNLQDQIITMNSDLKAKKQELASISGQIVEKKEAPIQLSAGQFIVGKDIPVGRYKITATGRGSNMFIYDSNGESILNEIISNVPDHGVPEYIIFLFDGYIIESHTPAAFQPIE